MGDDEEDDDWDESPTESTPQELSPVTTTYIESDVEAVRDTAAKNDDATLCGTGTTENLHGDRSDGLQTPNHTSASREMISEANSGSEQTVGGAEQREGFSADDSLPAKDQREAQAEMADGDQCVGNGAGMVDCPAAAVVGNDFARTMVLVRPLPKFSAHDSESIEINRGSAAASPVNRSSGKHLSITRNSSTASSSRPGPAVPGGTPKKNFAPTPSRASTKTTPVLSSTTSSLKSVRSERLTAGDPTAAPNSPKRESKDLPSVPQGRTLSRNNSFSNSSATPGYARPTQASLIHAQHSHHQRHGSGSLADNRKTGAAGLGSLGTPSSPRTNRRQRSDPALEPQLPVKDLIAKWDGRVRI